MGYSSTTRSTSIHSIEAIAYHIIELIILLSYFTSDSDSIDSSALSLTQVNRSFFLSYGIHVEELG